MAIDRPSAIDIDDEFAKATLHEIAAQMGIELSAQTSGQLRLPCLFCDGENTKSYGSLVINLDHPANLFKAHCCGVKGNRLTLMYVWKYGTLPSGGSVRGEAYNEMVKLHRTFTGSLPEDSPPPQQVPTVQEATRKEIAKVLKNVRLKDSEREDIRALATLFEDFIVDSQRMAPKAAQYVRKRKLWMTPDLMREFRVGWSPSRSMFRKNYLIYAHEDITGNVLSYSGRDLYFEEKLLKWEKASRPESKKPIKHKFVKGFHKGQLLYGRSNRRLTPAMRESIAKFGLIIVEGMNDVMRLSCFPLGAEGLCMNRATDEQIALIVEDAKRYAGSRVWLMPDNDKEGLAGFQELLWKLQQDDAIDARPGWPKELSHVPEPEELTDEELAEVLAPFLLRGQGAELSK